MTLQELATLKSADLKKLTDKELHEILSPYFPVTRPELAVKPDQRRKENISKPIPSTLSTQQRMMMAMLEEEGVDIGFLNRRKKK